MHAPVTMEIGRRERLGIGLIDVVIATFLMGVCGLIFAVSFSSAYAVLRQSNDYNLASRVCREEMEAVRSLGYAYLTPTALRMNGAIDSGEESSPYSITAAKNLNSRLPSGSGDLAITDETSALKRIAVTVRWRGADGCQRVVGMTSFIADKSALVRS